MNEAAEPNETLEDARRRWKYRRIMSFAAVTAVSLMLGYLTVFGSNENAVQAMLAQSLPLGLFGIVMAYIGGPIADDWLQLRVNRS